MSAGPVTWTVLGVGDPGHGDDEFGLSVLNRLIRRPELVGVVGFHACSPTLFGILEAWQGHTNVVTIGTARSGGRPHGYTYRCAYATGAQDAIDHLPEDMRRGEPLGLALELGAALGILPNQLIVYATHGCVFQPGTGLSRPVTAAVSPLVTRICDDILAAPPPPPPTVGTEGHPDPGPQDTVRYLPRHRHTPRRLPGFSTQALRGGRGPTGSSEGARDA
ncbi:hypothetical protein KDL01_15415 [Actinospica durhamensis]|uniref:Hydrogenase maturation protease n=1 Tax=Actinospica durhamensis TaxID=1508375 RepID=A0A941EMZ5_9ACTN|nr:hypothetical protein [Actinospica durhamensis]MBR7834662.1 hypothetical protein [Actinospica durhamensis]